jgi:lipopolysaccharide transport system ATP-binding protein
MSAVIEVRNIGKEYKLGTVTTRNLREDIAGLFGGKRNAAIERVWAVQDVSFDVEPGQALGIIGKNGAGKSTLLKILSRVTAPTTGIIRAKGRIASLLEVGTGFHPELTGRENIFLNGAILGMSKAEIRRKMDEIIAFSGVAKYVDTPVKRYSSGMYVRLAFAVAAHLESEILIMDEVLAVGDAEFQKKCLGKMNDVARNEGRTVLFVSHNMAAVTQLCASAIMLAQGKLVHSGTAEGVVNEYLKWNASQVKRIGFSDETMVKAIRFVGAKEVKDGLAVGQVVELEIDLEPQERGLSIDLYLKHRDSIIATASSAYHSTLELEAGVIQTVRCTLGPINLGMGSFAIDLEVTLPKVKRLERYEDCIMFDVDKQPVSNLYHAQLEAGARFGYFVPQQAWQHA